MCVDWESYAKLHVKHLKTIYTLNRKDDFVKDILTDLLTETRFCEWWEILISRGTLKDKKS